MTRILVIEDDECMRELVGLHLGNAGYDAVLADDALQGAAALLREPFDAVVSDVQMPLLDGLQLLAAAKADAATRDTPFILITGSVGALNRPEARLAAACLLKPLASEDLLDAVSSALADAERASRQAA
jgi:two-component system chemotaxis response regulator CheY